MPGVIALPPLVFLGGLVAGVFLQWLMPVKLFPPGSSFVPGMLLCLAGGAVGGWGFVTLLLAGTAVRPDRPTTLLVTGGPFRFSRNPLYLSLAMCYLGTTFLFNALWPLITFAPMLVVVHRGIIVREERYLEAKFGDAYRTYKSRVRRWL